MPAAPALAPGWRCVPGDRCLPQCAGPGRRRGGEDPREPPDYRSQGASAIALPPIAGPASSTLVVLAGSALEEFQRKSGQKLEATGRGKGRRKARRRRAGARAAPPRTRRAPPGGGGAQGTGQRGPSPEQSRPAPRPCADPRPRPRLERRPTLPPRICDLPDARRRPEPCLGSPRSLGGSGPAPAPAATRTPHAFPGALFGAEGKRRSRPAQCESASGRSGADTARGHCVCACSVGSAAGSARGRSCP